MPRPTPNDYFEAVQNLRSSVHDEELREGEPARTPLGLPMLWSGAFAQVFKVHCPASDNTWALKCFTRESPRLRDRYREIAAHLDEARLPFTVEFQWLEPGIRAGGAWYPLLKMRWVEGLTLNQFVEENLRRPRNLRMLLDLWPRLAARLRQTSIAHGDLQHGNVLLVPMPRGRLALKLIDYDGMHVPTLAGTRSGELGHPAYQHPQRLREGTYSHEVDRFSHLAIYTSIRCLIAKRRALWGRFYNGENLLFREQDFQDPANSEVFGALWRFDDPECRALAGRLALACRHPLDEAPLLDEVVIDGKVRPLAPSEESAVAALLAERQRPAALQPAQRPDERRLLHPGRLLETGIELSADPLAGGAAPWWTPGSSPPPNAQPPLPSTLPTAAADTVRASALEPLPEEAVDRSHVAPLPRLVRYIDRVLAVLAGGPENTILHGFLRGLAACATGLAPALLLALGVKIAVAFPSEFATAVAVVLLLFLVILALAVGPVEAAHTSDRLQREPPSGQPPGPARDTITNSIGMKLALVPPGEFMMGSPESEKNRYEDEGPQHRVRITRPFYLGVYEVTQEQWEAVMGGNPSAFSGDPQRPVERVSWQDALEFCRKLSEKEGKQYRLPTEAEWEYACRAGTTTRWSFGDDEARLEDYAWFSGNAGGSAHPVGQKSPNTWSLFDMHGNVWEWCADWYNAGYYAVSEIDNPVGPDRGETHVLRGGSWLNSPRITRSAYRLRSTPAARSLAKGFRVARTP